MTDQTETAGQPDPPMTATEVAANAGSPQALAAAGQPLAQGTQIAGAPASSTTGSTGAGEQAGATSDPSAQALEEAWREQLVNDIVSRLQQKALAAAPSPTPAPAATPKPSPSRIVIFRDGTGNEYPAVITRVYSGGAVALFVFRDDSNSTHSYGAQTQIDPSSEGQLGWFWPPRV